MAQQGGEELAKREEAAPAPVSASGEAGTTAAAAEEKSVYDAPATLKDKDTNVDPESVKAPGLMDRAKEEVEAMAESLQEKLDLGKSSDESPAPAAAVEKTDKAAAAGKEHKDVEQAGLFKRLLKKFGIAKN